MTPVDAWPRTQFPSAYFYVAYPRWVRCLRWIASKISNGVFYCEMKTARFYDPTSGDEVTR